MAYVKETWVCIGRVRLADEKRLGWEFKVLGPNDEPLPREMVYDKAPTTACPGAVYEVEVDRSSPPDVTAKIRGAKWLHRLGGPPLVEWSARDAAAVAAHRAAKEQKKAQGVDPFKDALAPIRRAYRRTDRVGQRIIIAAIVQYLERYGDE